MSRHTHRASWFVAIGVISLALAAASAQMAGAPRLYVNGAGSALVQRGLAAAAPADAAAFKDVPAPGVRMVPNEAQATTAAWLDSNGWRFQRGLKKVNYAKLPAGSAALAAAEAFTFDVEAILNPDPADVDELGRMLEFLKPLSQPAMPAMANIGIIDDGSPLMSEVLNLLTRRNLLYRVVSAPDKSLNLTVRLGSPDFPAESARNPSDFAARVRAKLGDENRLVRLYGTSTVIAHLTGDRTRARLHLLSFGSGRRGGGQGAQGGGQGGGARAQQPIRVRVLGRYQPAKLSAYGAADAQLTDVENPGNTTEFFVPSFTTLAVIDLTAIK